MAVTTISPISPSKAAANVEWGESTIPVYRHTTSQCLLTSHDRNMEIWCDASVLQVENTKCSRIILWNITLIIQDFVFLNLWRLTVELYTLCDVYCCLWYISICELDYLTVMSEGSSNYWHYGRNTCRARMHLQNDLIRWGCVHQFQAVCMPNSTIWHHGRNTSITNCLN
jgi:hypothetical protein